MKILGINSITSKEILEIWHNNDDYEYVDKKWEVLYTLDFYEDIAWNRSSGGTIDIYLNVMTQQEKYILYHNLIKLKK